MQPIATGPLIVVAHLQSRLQLPIAFFLEYSKTDKNQLQSVATGFLSYIYKLQLLNIWAVY